MSTKEERIIELMGKNDITSYKDLLHRILKNININDNDLSDKQYKNYVSNFSKMIHGDRPISRDLIIPLERVLKTTFEYIEEGTGDPSVEIESKGLRFVAKSNKYAEYEKIANEIIDNSDTRVIKNTDEYDKSILHYILEYNSLEGIRFLIEQENLVYKWYHGYFDCNINGIYENLNISKLIDMIIDLDDDELFNKVFGIYEIDFAEYKNIFNNENYIKILKSKNLIDQFIKVNKFQNKTYFSGFEREFVNPFATKLLETAINNKMNDKAIYILNKAIEINDEILSNILSFYKFGEIEIKENGEINTKTIGKRTIGILIYPNIINDEEINTDVKEAIEKAYKKINKYNNTFSKDYFEDDYFRIKETEKGTTQKLHSNNKLEYEMYEFFKDEKIQIPRLINIKGGIDEFEKFEGKPVQNTYKFIIEKDEFFEIVKFFKKFDNMCMKKYGGKTIKHGKIERDSFLFTDRKLNLVINWSNCELGDKLINLKEAINLCLKFMFGLNGYDEIAKTINEAFDLYELNKEYRLEIIKQLLDKYNDKVRNFKKEKDEDGNVYKQLVVYKGLFEYMLFDENE